MLAATCIGVAKSGLSGVSMVHVLVFASVFDAQASTGIVLPMLIVGDIAAIRAYGRHANWDQVRRMMPPAIVGVLLGWGLMNFISGIAFRPLIGCLILCLAVLQLIRLWKEAWFEHFPHATWFAWTMGLLVGSTTMLANAAGPVFSLYLLALALPKLQFVGTSAWFFLVLNSLKVPFSYQLGLITLSTLGLNIVLVPFILGGLFLGKQIVARLPQRFFDSLILAFAATAALIMLFKA
jgi:uncharacterized protein